MSNDDTPAETPDAKSEGKILLHRIVDEVFTQSITLRQINATVDRIDHKVAHLDDCVDSLKTEVSGLKDNVRSMRPKLASMPDTAREVAEGAIDKRELEAARKSRDTLRTIMSLAIGGVGATALWESFLRPFLHR